MKKIILNKDQQEVVDFFLKEASYRLELKEADIKVELGTEEENLIEPKSSARGEYLSVTIPTNGLKREDTLSCTAFIVDSDNIGHFRLYLQELLHRIFETLLKKAIK